MMKRNIIFGFIVLSFIVYNFTHTFQYNQQDFSLNQLKNLAFADTEGTPYGTWPNCEGLATFGPNGGSWQYGVQEPEQQIHTEYFEIRYNGSFSIGFFLNKALAEAATQFEVEAGIQTKLYVQYTCDRTNTECCAQNNWYYP